MKTKEQSVVKEPVEMTNHPLVPRSKEWQSMFHVPDIIANINVLPRMISILDDNEFFNKSEIISHTKDAYNEGYEKAIKDIKEMFDNLDYLTQKGLIFKQLLKKYEKTNELIECTD